MVGERTSDDAEVFLTDLASRLEGRVQPSTDGHGYVERQNLTMRMGHQSLKQRYPRTPAMAAGVADHVWSLEETAALLD